MRIEWFRRTGAAWCLVMIGLRGVAAAAPPPPPSGLPAGWAEPEVRYEVPLDPPDLRPSAPGVKIIRNNADWADVNDDRYRVFYVMPGDYREAGQITLTADGTQERKRWLLWRNPGGGPGRETHPYHVPQRRRAMLDRLKLQDASHWVIDGLRLNRSSVITDGSHHNVLNRLLIWEMDVSRGRSGIVLRGGSHHNTIQNCVIAKTTPTPQKDAAGVYVHNADDTHIVSNEIFDIPGDSVQTGQSRDHARATVIQNNDMYLTPAMYTDGEGNFTPGGNYAAAENAVDIKAGWQPDSELAPKDRWILIEHNRMWGFRRTDPKAAATGSGGAHVVIHFTTSSGVRVRYNKLWDGRRGITVSKNETLGPIHHHDVHDNVIWDIKGAVKPRHIDDSKYQRNVIVGSDNWLLMRGDHARRNTIRHNVLINSDLASPGRTYQPSNTLAANAYYNSTPHETASRSRGDLIFPDASAAEHQPLTVRIKRLTDPATVRIPFGRPTPRSPHAAWFGLGRGSSR